MSCENIRPLLSITGYPTILVSESALRGLFKQLQVWGATTHGVDAADVWAITSVCRSRHIPYHVKLLKGPDGVPKAVTVQDPMVRRGAHLAEGWSADLLESFTPSVAKKLRPG